MFRALGLLAAVGLISACSHIEMQVPVAGISAPEVLKDDAWQMDVIYQDSRSFTVTDDASSRPPEFDNRDVRSGLASGGVAYGLREGLSIGGGITSDIGLFGKLSYQFLGTSWVESGQGWSAAAHVQGHYKGTNKSGDQNGAFGAGGYNWKADGSMTAFGAGLSVGYRFNDSVLMYAGASQLSHKVKTEIVQDRSDNGLDAGGTYSDTSSGSSSAVGVGFLFGTGTMRLEPSASWVNYAMNDKTESEAMFAVSLSFGGRK